MQQIVRRVASVVVAAGLSAGMTALAVEPASAVARSTATVHEYGKIKAGASLAQVRKVIGAGGTRVYSDEFGAGEQVFVWKSTKGKNVYVGFKDGRAVGKARQNDTTVSAAEYRKLKKGQRYSKVSSIIREKGKRVYNERRNGKTYAGYVWVDDSLTKTVAVVFVNGKLSAKALLPIEK